MLNRYLQTNIISRAIILTLCSLLFFKANYASTVSAAYAQSIAAQIIKQVSENNNPQLSLLQTQTSAQQDTLYYVFDLNNGSGFIIIAADNAVHPLIGYSLESSFKQPVKGVGLALLLNQRQDELTKLKHAEVMANKAIRNEWTLKADNQVIKKERLEANYTIPQKYVSPLLTTTWNQSPYYNASCPGGSVTGCVATAMAQILKYWNYPVHGKGVNTYCSCHNDYTAGFGTATNTYGNITYNFGTATFNYGNMPASISAANTDIANIMFAAGVSVNMDYSPGGSSAYLLTENNGACSQKAFVQYFAYDSTTIRGLVETNYADTTWAKIIQNEIFNRRPVQFGGLDLSDGGGHSWVCDGYDSLGTFHMNWGWGGDWNGYFSLQNLNPGYVFDAYREALIGIQPPKSNAIDAGIVAFQKGNLITCDTLYPLNIALQNYGIDTLKSCTISTQVDNGPPIQYNWTGKLAPAANAQLLNISVSLSVGAHVLKCYTSQPDSAIDAKPSNDTLTRLIVNRGDTTGLQFFSQGFEAANALPAGWIISDPLANTNWEVLSSVAKTGKNCMAIDNCGGHVDDVPIGMVRRVYTPSINLTGPASMITFDVAYASGYFPNVLLTDTLVIYASTNCGQSWQPIYRKGGQQLATAPRFNIDTTSYYLGCFQPTSSQWRNDTINLTALQGTADVQLAIEDRSGWGSFIYIDNFTLQPIPMNTGIGTNGNTAATSVIAIYPNPASESITLTATNAIKVVGIYDLLGNQLSMQVQLNQTQISLPMNQLNDGIYLVKVQTTQDQQVLKVVKRN